MLQPTFAQILDSHLSETSKKKWQETLQQVEQKKQTEVFLMFFARLPRLLKVYKKPLEDLPEVQNHIKVLEHWTLDEVARVEFIRRFQEIFPLSDLLHKCFQHGDNSEQKAILKSLAFLNKPEQFCPIAEDAIRTNVSDVFAALACNNYFPKEYLGDLGWQNLVLKTIFMELPVTRILGIEEREDPQLCKMVQEWIEEREAASRSVPNDVRRIFGE